ncbi:NAD(P)-dependent oxidoreductase [Bengtsoniella intestinalis]|uniref:NAD(P)-dependent oxidoreductase n=1 Tax=Bengtsoniella intestinalis TaxID=3073143 RepID=UPI00391F8406
MFEKLVAVDPVNLKPDAQKQLSTFAKKVVLYPDLPQSNQEMIARIGDADAALISYTSTMERDVLVACPNLHYVGMCCSLYEEASANVDIAAARELGITVTGIRDYGDPGVAEYVISELVRYLHGFGDKAWMAEQKELTDLNVGIVGLGVTGQLIANRLQPFGVNISYFSRTRKPDCEARGMVYLPLNDLMEQCQVVCLCLNKNMLLLQAEQFAHFGNHKILFNTSIGPGHDVTALEQWLNHGDNEFFCDMPTGAGSPELLNHPHVNCVRKSAGFTYEAAFRLGDKVIENMRQFLEA